MNGDTRKRKYVGQEIRALVAKNLKAELAAEYGEQKNHARLFEKDHGVVFATTQRILAGKGCSLDMIELIARKLDIHIYQLFAPTVAERKVVSSYERDAAEWDAKSNLIKRSTHRSLERSPSAPLTNKRRK